MPWEAKVEHLPKMAAFWNGQQYDPKVFTKLNDRIAELENRLQLNNFVVGRTFNQGHIAALKMLQKLGNDASRPSGIVLKDKPKVIEAMLVLAKHVGREFITSPVPTRGFANEFDAVLLALFDKHSISSKTRGILAENEILSAAILEKMTKGDLLSFGIASHIANHMAEAVIPEIPACRVKTFPFFFFWTFTPDFEKENF